MDRIVRPLIGTAVTPHHLTALRLLTGIAAALLMARDDPFRLDFAGAIFSCHSCSTMPMANWRRRPG